MLRRIWPKIKDEIPIDQAAYQSGRSTTEQVFSVKALCEKAITCQNCTVHLLLLDMSKAFDTVNRKVLFEHLDPLLEPGELYYLSILTNRPKLKVKLDNTISDPFTTTQGIMQGDCLSAILFIFYLAKALKDSKLKVNAERNGTFYIEPKYADDITIASINNKDIINNAECEFPTLLKNFNLTTNETKTEHHTIPQPTRTPKPSDINCPNSHEKILWSELDWVLPPQEKTTDPTWKNCKLLGSRLDSQQDIKTRKGIVMNNMKKLQKHFTSRYLSIKSKMKYFSTYIDPIFLYNSELWTANNTTNNEIDSFHRRMLRKAINKTWPKNTYTNTELYNNTQAAPWSEVIKTRRIRWTGHLLRLNPSTPARISLNELTRPTPKKRGRTPNTWLKTIYNDLEGVITDLPRNPQQMISKLETLASNKKSWREIVRRSTVQKN